MSDQPPPTFEEAFYSQLAALNATTEQVAALQSLFNQALVTAVDSGRANFDDTPPIETPSPASTPAPTSATPTLLDLITALSKLNVSQPKRENKIKLQPLEKFDGSSTRVEPFIASLKRHIFADPEQHKDLGRTLLWALDSFTGKAEKWASMNSDRITANNFPWYTLELFYDDLRKSFGSVTRKLEAQDALRGMRMKKSETIGEFVIRYRTEAELSDWNDDALISCFRAAIPSDSHFQILTLNQGLAPKYIATWYTLAQTLDQVHHSVTSSSSSNAHPFPRTRPSSRSPPPSAPATVPSTSTSDAMDVDAHRRKPKGVCWRCHQPGHTRRDCLQQRAIRMAEIKEIVSEVMAGLVPPPVPPKSDFPPPQQ